MPNDTASSQKKPSTDRMPRSTPAEPEPNNLAKREGVSMRPARLWNASRLTRLGSTDSKAGLKIPSSAPMIVPVTINRSMFKAPRMCATGIASTTTARIPSTMMATCRRFTRSTTAPATNPTTVSVRLCAIAITAIAAADPVNCRASHNMAIE